MRDGGFHRSIPRGRGTSLVGRYLHRGTSLPFVGLCDGACLWVWLLGWPPVFLPELHQAVKCPRWFRCVSLDWETGRGGGSALQDKELREEVTGKAHLWGKKKKSQIKQTGKEIALRAAKEIVLKTYYFSAESISAWFLTLLPPSVSLSPPPPHFSLLLPFPSLNSEETKGVQTQFFFLIVDGSRHS